MPRIRWTKADVNKAQEEALNPPQAVQGQGKGFFPNMAEKIKEIASRNRGVNKPQ